MTKIEKAWMSALAEMPCIVCNTRPVQIHHILDGGRRMGHLFTIPLCFNHHQSGRNDPEIASRHPWKREFEKRHGTELVLLAKVKARLEVAA